MTLAIQQLRCLEDVDAIMKLFASKHLRFAKTVGYVGYFCTANSVDCSKCQLNNICASNIEDDFDEVIKELNILKKERLDKYPENYI